MSKAFITLKVLVVDDNAHMRAMVNTLLSGVGITQIKEAADGAAALAILQTWKPDAAIIDCQMSPMDGIVFTRKLRAAGGANATLPIVMMTGYADHARVVEARDAGISEILAKPISPKHLLERLEAAVFEPRPFVRSDRYTGPSRRRVTRPSDKKRRLTDKPVHIIAD